MNADAKEIVRSQRLYQIRTARYLRRITLFEDFIETLEDDDLFDRKKFRALRVATLTQAEWAEMVGVSQATIGNWERGATYPARHHRKSILRVAKDGYNETNQIIDEYRKELGIQVNIDLRETTQSLNSSILNAAITDFNFDKSTGQIIPVPFSSDDRFSNIDDLRIDKENLLSSLSEQANLIIDGLSKGANTETDRLIEYFSKYQNEALKPIENPRLLHRLGSTLAKRTSSDDVRNAISGWDEDAIDGFNSDHLELMRLYFREALAKAQEVEALPIEDDDDAVSHKNFFEAAELLESVKSPQGSPVFDPDIPTLLRDIGNEIRDLGEAETFTADDRRRAILRRRRLEAVKNGSIYIGRVLFFTSLFIVMNPATLSAVGSVASILGLVDLVAPGSIKKIYEKLRGSFPILPPLGETKRK